jgi:energy-coupling factor transporter ATP-binding protein EcfA2
VTDVPPTFVEPIVLAFHGARYWYPATKAPAIDGVDLELRAGEVVGLVGPNDAGKSTLCLLAAGLAPTSIGGKLEGEVRLGDRPTSELALHESAQRAGILFQNPVTQLSGTALTVWEEVAFGPRNLGLPTDEIATRVQVALDALRIEALAERDPLRLSGGQAQLVALAAVLALRPPCLVLDEPTSQLDPLGTRLVGEALALLTQATGTGILLVEHKTDLIAAIADRVVVLDSGRAVMHGAADDILADPALEEHGVEAPSRIRLGRRLIEAGVDPGVLTA